jgi:hypothetical protein
MSLSPKAALLGLALSVIAPTPGCVDVPAVYEMRPEVLEVRRGSIHSVGVVIATYPPASKQVRPGRGVLGGAWRGMVRGAMLPILIGFVSPVPGGTLMGAFLAPFTAIIGATYGAFISVSGKKIDQAKHTLALAEQQLAKDLLVDRLRADVISAGVGSGIEFVGLPQLGPRQPGEELAYDEFGLAPLDVVLEIRVERLGLTGRWSINPPTRSYLELVARVYRVSDNLLVFDESMLCSSEVERPFTEWAQGDGVAFLDQANACIPELAEKVVSDLFLVYPLP